MRVMNRFFLISIGAMLGANARYFVGLWAAQRFGVTFPYGTIIVNITGSLILGFLVAWGSARSGLSPSMRLFLTVGFLGAYTTFSSLTVETLLEAEQAGQAGQARALLNLLVNNGLGLAAAWLGMFGARILAVVTSS